MLDVAYIFFIIREAENVNLEIMKGIEASHYFKITYNKFNESFWSNL